VLLTRCPALVVHLALAAGEPAGVRLAEVAGRQLRGGAERSTVALFEVDLAEMLRAGLLVLFGVRNTASLVRGHERARVVAAEVAPEHAGLAALAEAFLDVTVAPATAAGVRAEMMAACLC